MVTVTRSKRYEMNKTSSEVKKKGTPNNKQCNHLEKRFITLKNKVVQMENNIKVLIKNNHVLNRRILKLQNCVSDLIKNDRQIVNCKNHACIKESARPTNSDSTIVNVINNKNLEKLIILADSHGRHLKDLFENSKSNNNLNVKCFFKPNAQFKDVVSGIGDITNSLTKNDFILCIGGTNDIEKKISIRDALEDCVKNCTNTNLVFSTVLYRHDSKQYLNKRIHKLNIYLSNFARLHNIPLIDVNKLINRSNYTFHGLHLNWSGKKRIVEQIIRELHLLKLNPSDVDYGSNLRSVNIQNKSTDNVDNGLNKSVSELVKLYENRSNSKIVKTVSENSCQRLFPSVPTAVDSTKDLSGRKNFTYERQHFLD